MSADRVAAALAERERRRRANEAPQEEPGVFKRALSRVQDFSEGLGVSGLETYYGLKDLVGKGEPTDRATLEAWRRAADESGWGTAGKITGDATQYMLPAGVLTRTLKMAPLMADMATITAVEAGKLPDRGESRIGNATDAAELGLAATGVGKLAMLPLTGVSGTPAAERLRDIGAKLTPGQLKEGLLRKVEHWTEAAVPFASKAVREAERRSAVSVDDALMQISAPPTVKTLFSKNPQKAKVKSMAELNKAYDDAYDAAWPSVKEIDTAAYDQLVDTTARALDSIAVKGDRKAMLRIIEDIDAIFKKDGGKMSEVDALLRKYRRDFESGENEIWNDAIEAIRTGMINAAPAKNRDAIRLINSTYGQREALGYAAQSAAGVRGKGLSPESLTSGVKRSSPSRRLEEGRGNLQQELRDWSEVVGDPAGVIPLLKRRLIQGAPSGGVLQYPADLVAGNYPWQAAIRRQVRKPLPTALRRTLSPYRVGALAESYLDEEER